MKTLTFWPERSVYGRMVVFAEIESSGNRRRYRDISVPSLKRLARLANNHQHTVVGDEYGISVQVYVRKQ